MKSISTLLGKTLATLTVLSAALATTSHAAVVGSSTAVNFAGGSTSFSFGGAVFTLSDNLTGFPQPVSVRTANGAEVRTVFGEPSVDFQTTIVYDNNFIQYGSFAQNTVIRFSATPSSLGLRVVLADGAHFGYALFSGTLLQSYGFETTPNTGILSGAPISAVPEPAAGAMMLGGLLVLGAGLRRRQSVGR